MGAPENSGHDKNGIYIGKNIDEEGYYLHRAAVPPSIVYGDRYDHDIPLRPSAPSALQDWLTLSQQAEDRRELLALKMRQAADAARAKLQRTSEEDDVEEDNYSGKDAERVSEEEDDDIEQVNSASWRTRNHGSKHKHSFFNTILRPREV